MAYISDNLMNDVWQKVGASGVDHVLAMRKRHQKNQKALIKFAYKHLLELREDAGGLGLYIFHVVVEAFSRLTPKPKAVRRPVIDRAWGLSPAALAQEAVAAEPHAVQYLQDAFDEEDEVVLTDSERAQCERVVQAAILSLHETCGKRL